MNQLNNDKLYYNVDTAHVNNKIVSKLHNDKHRQKTSFNWRLGEQIIHLLSEKDNNIDLETDHITDDILLQFWSDNKHYMFSPGAIHI